MGTITPLIILAFGIGSVAILGATIGFTGPQWARYVVFALLFIVFVVTPTRLGVRQLRLSQPLLEIGQVFETNKGHGGLGWGLVIHNRSSESAYECRANLEDLDFEIPSSELTLRKFPRRDLYWTGQYDDKAYEIPVDQKATLNVMYFSHALQFENPMSLTLAYRASEEFRADNKLTMREPVLALININSRGYVPQFVVCRLDLEVARNRILRGVSGRDPLEILWQGSKRRRLSDFQRESSTLPLEMDDEDDPEFH